MRSGRRSHLLVLWRSAHWLLRPLLPPLRLLSRHLFGTFVLLGLVALVLGFLGLWQHFRSDKAAGEFAWPNVFFFTFTLFFADSTVFQGLGGYPVMLEIARFLAPLATAAGLADAAGALFARRWEAVRARHQHDHVVVCGMTTTARALVDTLCIEGRNVVYIAEDAAEAFPDRDRPPTLLRVTGDPREQRVLKAASAARAEVVYACLDDSAANVSIAQATKLLVLESRRGFRDAPLRCIARVDTAGLVTGLRARRLRASDSAVFRLDFFAADEVGARALLDRHRPGWDSGPPPRVGIVGFTSFGQALLVELARRWVLARPSTSREDGADAKGETGAKGKTGASDRTTLSLPVTVLDPNASRSLHHLRRRHPILDALAVDAVDVPAFDFEAFDFADTLMGADPGESATPCSGSAERQPRYVYVCRDDDEVSLLTGLEVARALHSINSRDARSGTTVIKIGRRQGFEEAFRPVTGRDSPTTTPMFDDVSGRLRFFAADDEALPVDLGGTDIIERFARAIHQRYLAHETANGSAMGSRPALRAWDELSADLQDSNRGQASNFGEALRSCDLTLMPATRDSAIFEFAPDEVERLAFAEHIRWMQEKEKQGYRYGDQRQDDGPDKRHPSMKPWEALDERERDRDRDAIRNMPAVLRDAGLQVVRLTDTPCPPPR